MSGTPKMIVPYEWILENVGEEPMTKLSSKMISFRGEKVFRVGLRNTVEPVEWPFLFFVAINLNKMGMKVKDVKYGIQGSDIGPATMLQMKRENIDDEKGADECLQLFTTRLDKKIVGNCTFAFRICIEGLFPIRYYSYQLSDRLAKDQLWAALYNQQNLVDVELIVQKQNIYAHKAILAARSKVFADEFEKIQLVKNVHHRIWIDGVKPSTVMKYLHFIYTGEPMGTFADEELLKLANKYRVLSLYNLCMAALRKIKKSDAAHTTTLIEGIIDIEGIINGVEEVSRGVKSSRILYGWHDDWTTTVMPEKDTEIIVDQTTLTFSCDLWGGTENRKPKCLMQYQGEDMFFAQFTGGRNMGIISKHAKAVIHFACAKHRRFGLQVEDIYCEIYCSSIHPKHKRWFKMEEKMLKNSVEPLQHFTFNLEFNLGPYNFDIKTVSTIGNYYYEMMDVTWFTDLWAAAINQKLTDIEIYAGTVKVMEAHRVILCARSPVLNASLSKIKITEKSIVTFEAEFDVEVVKNFLNFLYTGRLESSASVHQLSKLATLYEVETLKNVCELLNASPPDAEELTNYLLEL